MSPVTVENGCALCCTLKEIQCFNDHNNGTQHMMVFISFALGHVERENVTQ